MFSPNSYTSVIDTNSTDSLSPIDPIFDTRVVIEDDEIAIDSAVLLATEPPVNTFRLTDTSYVASTPSRPYNDGPIFITIVLHDKSISVQFRSAPSSYLDVMFDSFTGFLRDQFGFMDKHVKFFTPDGVELRRGHTIRQSELQNNDRVFAELIN